MAQRARDRPDLFADSWQKGEADRRRTLRNNSLWGALALRSGAEVMHTIRVRHLSPPAMAQRARDRPDLFADPWQKGEADRPRTPQ
jgi:hypothetical protein